MSVPTLYPALALQSYMLTVTGNLGTVLGLSTSDFVEAVTDTLIAYGVDVIGDATDIAKLRALAKVEAWRTAKANAAGRTDFDADGASFKRSQLIMQAQMNLDMAENEAMSFGLTGYAVTVGRLIHANDPYPLLTDEDE